MSHVLVTGGTGFVGSHAVLQLLQAGHRVRTTVRSAAREREVREMMRTAGVDPADRLEVVVADLNADAGWADAVAGCEYSSPRRVALVLHRLGTRRRCGASRAGRHAARAAGRA
ncbi:MAG: GDP-mannose 4,6-dehydratase [Vicinamibacterales bacterium]